MRVLCIDGGGIRGIIPAVVLAELERRAGRPVSDLFDLIAGTSTGGILACALALPAQYGDGPAYAAADLVALYEREGPGIFRSELVRRIRTVDGLVDERYDSAGLRSALERYLGDAPLSAARTELLVTAYEIERRAAFFFRSARAREDPAYDFRLVDVAHATSAAPTYFEPVAVTDVAGLSTWSLIDGGVFATNPAMCAVAEVARAGAAPPIDVLLSLGTGSLTRPLPIEQVRGWGRLEWAPRIVDVVFDGVSQTVDFQAARLLGDRYVRLQPTLDRAGDDMDDASPGNLAALRATAEELIRERSGELDRALELLSTG